MARMVADWTEAYLEYTSGLVSPDIYRRWAAFCVIAAALQRRVYIEVQGQRQRANLYVLLVGPPATGKSNALKVAYNDFLAEMSVLTKAPTDCTKEAFYQVLEGADSTYEEDSERQAQSAVVGFFDEWAVFLKPRDEAFMSFLSDIYDNPPVRDYKLKTQPGAHIEYPNLTMAGGVTMKQLRERFTDSTLESGFPSRIIMVYSEEEIQVAAGFKVRGMDRDEELMLVLRHQKRELRKAMMHDLQSMTLLEGEYEWDPAAADLALTWTDAGLPPQPSDPRLTYYAKRRMSHFCKLCMIHSAMKRDDLVVMIEDVEQSKKFLLEAEGMMPYAVSALGSNEYFDQMKFARKVVEEYCRVYNNRPCPEHVLREKLLDTVPIHLTAMLIDSLVKARWIEQCGDSNDSRFSSYRPVEK